jgi:hypothetical protein
MVSTFDAEWMTEKTQGNKAISSLQRLCQGAWPFYLDKARREALQPAEEIGAATRAVGPRGKHGFIRAQPGSWPVS